MQSSPLQKENIIAENAVVFFVGNAHLIKL
jgi:hypothetical protein